MCKQQISIILMTHLNFSVEDKLAFFSNISSTDRVTDEKEQKVTTNTAYGSNLKPSAVVIVTRVLSHHRFLLIGCNFSIVVTDGQ